MTVTLHLGDCLDVMRGMADNGVDLILTDPPPTAPAQGEGVPL